MTDAADTRDGAGSGRSARTVLTLIGIGLFAGFLSGLFGVGGGIVIVPALVLLAGYNQRLAAGTSLAAIVPTATVGVISYATSGAVLWLPALVLAAAAVVGAQIGTSLAPRVPQRLLPWGFVVFLVAVIVSLFLVIPSRDGVFEITVVSGIGLVVLGMITGTLSGLLGVGGGIIVVPMLVLLFGVSDLAAKGTSLLMMIPTALSGTVGNLRNKNVDIVAALLIGGAACTTTALGAWLSKSIDPMTGNIVFAVFLLAVGARMALQALRNRY